MFQAFGDVLGHGEGSSHADHNSVFHSVLKQVPWRRFDQLVDEHGADKHVRTLTTKSQFIALMYAQLSGAQSLREIEAGLQSHATRLYHLGSDEVSRSTLADANAQRPWQVFSGLFAHLVGQLTRGLKRKTGEAVHLIDSSSLRLSALSKDWARFSAGVCGAKMHIVYDPDAICPIYAAVTPANINDITAAKVMPIEAGATYVFDLGYYDYCWWAKLHAADCRIVTRLKSNTKLRVVHKNAVAAGSNILSDRIGHLPQRMARNRQNPFQDPVREIRVRIDTGKILRILTNDLDLPATDVADLYKRRWQIELFFRWVKQTLKITVRWTLRKCRAHSDRSSPDRLPIAAPGTHRPASCSRPAHLHPPGARKPHAQTTDQPAAPSATSDHQRSATVEPQPMLNLNRTAVGQARA